MTDKLRIRHDCTSVRRAARPRRGRGVSGAGESVCQDLALVSCAAQGRANSYNEGCPPGVSCLGQSMGDCMRRCLARERDGMDTVAMGGRCAAVLLRICGKRRLRLDRTSPCMWLSLRRCCLLLRLPRCVAGTTGVRNTPLTHLGSAPRARAPRCACCRNRPALPHDLISASGCCFVASGPTGCHRLRNSKISKSERWSA